MKISGKWMTTFIYEQDLRSYYMNNILYPLLHTGVFNSDISISSGNGILFLNIKKGTTFIFSNDYVDIKNEVDKGDTVIQGNKNTIMGRSFNGKSNDSYGRKGEAQISLIKCVALEDMTIRLNYHGHFDSISQSTDEPHVNANGFNKPVYIGAIIKYSAEGGTSSFSDPVFRLLVNNDSYTPDYPEEGATAEADSKYFYKFISPTNNTTDNLGFEANIPDGIQTMSSSSQMVYWLMLGVINPIDREWSAKDSYAFDGDWYKNHVFTGRGIPEYRYPLVLGKEVQSPEIMFDTPCVKKEDDSYIEDTTGIGYKSLYLDADKIINNGRIYSSTIDWRQFYGVGPFKHISEIVDNGTTLNPKFIKLEFPSIKDYINTIIPKVTRDFVCVYDVVFACSRNNITNEEGSLSSRKLNLISYRGFTEDSGVTSHFSNDLYDNLSTTNREMYLDISPHNIEDLADILVNRDFLSIAIEGLRKDGTLDPNSYGESLIPVCIIFRPFRVKENGENMKNPMPIGLPTGPDDDPKYFDYFDCIKPSNVLSFFDIAYKMTELNPITVRTQDAFTVVPVMN